MPICEECNRDTQILHRHRKIKELGYIPSNIQRLCSSCHGKKKSGHKKNNDNNFGLQIFVDTYQTYPRPYWPKELINNGFTGNMGIIQKGLTATIIRPNASLEQVKKSLQIILQDVELRMERAKSEAK